MGRENNTTIKGNFSLVLVLLCLIPLQSFAYQAYWTDALVRRFGGAGKTYDQEIGRVGASYSRQNMGVWGKIDRIENNSFGPAYAGDLGGLYRYGKFSTTGGIGFGNDFHLRSNRLYILEQRYYTEGDRFIPLVGYAREEYLGAPQSYYDFYRVGLSTFITPGFILGAQLQKIENSFSGTDNVKKGRGLQLMGIYQTPKWMGQVAVIHNCLGETASCKGSRDTYEEWLTVGSYAFTEGWFLRGGFSYIRQSSRFVAPFSGQVVNSSTVSSELFTLGLMHTLP